ncbi:MULTISPECIES: stage V sporulation protein AC [Brevibacillus]|jgi:stage V sporulation protein AC|uniref:Stage V sporulation protein AC n=1 Tax=Brevibacillus borstelensis AK1 TaxID=1300222 RepID=M8E6I1_9BACL|nr:stage V sporulation protein AC [Brevibacillus borstelensis]EMT54876.1 stage V sporulation protein AC [Brevibacillus borstelensis AK1]KKX52714.1 stage V sporulation protein AC [Brevibacillus borstelensis cifa_chp40]MBE5395641.1 stage V sporulation protein AC [Brevibacillus borstelensis]MCC0567265.1 stage V sporulation protein AC [Brevibacillus borstelensis]MCM3473516.1 stage V sporulation protein AC [Brevibacillus borstelensis]
MADQKKKKLTPVQQEYQQLAKRHEPPRPLLRNFTRAFFTGGIICLIGQGIQEMFIRYFDFTEKTAGNPTTAVLIFLSALLTGLGVYDRIAQWAGAGTSVPVTGFANSIASAAIDHRSEGFVLGVGGNMFKLAGSVIVFGVFSAFVIGIVKTLIKMGG